MAEAQSITREDRLVEALEYQHLTVLRLSMDSWGKNDHELWKKHFRDKPDCGACALINKPENAKAPA